MATMEGLENNGYHVNELKTEDVKEVTNDINLQERTGEGGDFSSTESKMAAGVVNENDDNDDDDNPDCGWFNIRPKLIQCFNGPAGYIFIISLFSIAQSTTVNGLVYVVTTTLEKRFNLKSARSGSISSMYDLATLSVIIFVTYFGERAHKPIWLGIGALIFSSGSFFFTLPHFLTENYEYGTASNEEVCIAPNTTSAPECSAEGDDENLSRYYFFFLAAQLLHGLGAAPLYTLGQAYVYDNCKARYAAVYIAIFQVAGNFAPAIGYIGGGLLLTTWTDMKVRDEIEIDPSNPLWVGNWWLGFMFTGGLALLTSVPLMAFPKRLPGAKKIELDRKKTAQKGSKFRPSGTSFVNKIGDLPRAVFNILKNIPCLCIYVGIGAEFFIVSSISVFGPKFIEAQFGLSAGEAAIFAGVVVIPSALGGVLLGGFLVKWFNWAFRGTIRFVVSALVLSWLMMLILLVNCPNIAFAGVTVQYGNPSQVIPIGDFNLSASCNINCDCGTDYDPICGTDDIMYYTACHAGCNVVDDTGDQKVYTNCGCIPPVSGSSDPGGSAVQGKCEHGCQYQSVFFAFIFFILLLTFVIVAPSVTSILSVVDENQRSLSLGLQSLFYRLLGTVPGPIIFGKLIDNACMIWEYECDGQQTCWLYDNGQFARSLFLVLFIGRAVSISTFCGSLFFYKPISEAESVDEKGPAAVIATDTPEVTKQETMEKGTQTA
ncbi:solute carrier organic anion transporter family member 4A1-like [Apostichopus japonicus]|uniref:solute carrier organic anion transporter family member 4A1-like n=1 Tax=Stichopus japonicus TaxID=307972 RepID=UPI003AB6753A